MGKLCVCIIIFQWYKVQVGVYKLEYKNVGILSFFKNNSIDLFNINIKSSFIHNNMVIKDGFVNLLS